MALDYDPGMENPLNAITDEVYDVAGNAGSVAVWPATDSCFFAESIDGNVYGSTTTNDPGEYTSLELYKDYVLGPANLKVSGRVARWVHSYIVLLRPMNFVKWSYHGVGGPMDATLQAEIAAASPFDVTDAGIWINFQGQLATMDAVAIDQAVVGLTPIEVLSNKLEKIAAIMAGSTDQLHPTLQALFNQREAEWQVLQQDITDALTNMQAGSDPRVNSLVALTGLPNNALADLGTGFSYIIDNSTIKAALLVVDGFLNLYRQHAATNGFWPIVAYAAGITFTATDLRKCIEHDVGGITVHFRYIGAVPYTTTGVWADEKQYFTSVWGDTKEITHGVDKEVLSEVMSLVRAQAAKLEDYHNWNRHLNEQNSVLLDFLARKTGMFPIACFERIHNNGYTYIHLLNSELGGMFSVGTRAENLSVWGNAPSFVRRTNDFVVGEADPVIASAGNGVVFTHYRNGYAGYWATSFETTTIYDPNDGTDASKICRGNSYKSLPVAEVYSTLDYGNGYTIDRAEVFPFSAKTVMVNGKVVTFAACMVYIRNGGSVISPVAYSLLRFDGRPDFNGWFSTDFVYPVVTEMLTGAIRNYKMGICNDNVGNIYWLTNGILRKYTHSTFSTTDSATITNADGSAADLNILKGAAPDHIVYDPSGYIIVATYPLALEAIIATGYQLTTIVKIDIRDFDNPFIEWSLDLTSARSGTPIYSALFGPNGNFLNAISPSTVGFHGGINVSPTGDIFVTGNEYNSGTGVATGVLIRISKGGVLEQDAKTERSQVILGSPRDVYPYADMFSVGQSPTIMGPPIGLPNGRGAVVMGLNALKGASATQGDIALSKTVAGNDGRVMVFERGANGDVYPAGSTTRVNVNAYLTIDCLYGPTGSPTRAGLPAPY